MIVDLSLCGARLTKYELTAVNDPFLVATYGEARCRELGSAVALAVAEMRAAGVVVVDKWAEWPGDRHEMQQQGGRARRCCSRVAGRSDRLSAPR